MTFSNQELMDGIAEIYNEWCVLYAEKDGCDKISLPDFENGMSELAEKLGVKWNK